MALKHLEELGREKEEGSRWRGEIMALMRG